MRKSGIILKKLLETDSFFSGVKFSLFLILLLKKKKRKQNNKQQKIMIDQDPVMLTIPLPLLNIKNATKRTRINFKGKPFNVGFLSIHKSIPLSWHKSQSCSFFATTAGSADTVDIGVISLRHVVVDDMSNIWDI